MELRALRYYLAVCEWGTMSRAAEELHVTQPALSRQIAALERELGCELLERHSRSVRPTEKALYLRRPAQESARRADQTSADSSHGTATAARDTHIGPADTASTRLIAQRVRAFRRLYPDVRFHLHSAVATDLMERLEHGLDDLVVLMSYPNDERCSHLRLPLSDAWGVAMRADDPLASREVITPADLTAGPLLMPERPWAGARLAGPLGAWFGDDGEAIEVAATYNLSFNATLLVQEGVGRMLTLEGLTPSEPGSGLAFRLLYPPAVSIIDVVWKRGATPSRAVSLFLESLREG